MKFCVGMIVDAAKGKITQKQAQEIFMRVDNLAKIRAATGEAMDTAIRAAAKVVGEEQAMAKAIAERAALLGVLTEEQNLDFVRRYPTLGEGLEAMLEGSSKVIRGGRESISAVVKNTHQEYVGKLYASLEKAGVEKDFQHGTVNKEVYMEMDEIRDGGTPGASGSPAAQKIAKAIYDLGLEMRAREMDAGIYVPEGRAYTLQQTHDRDAFRKAGSTPGNSAKSKQEAFTAWAEFTRPLIDYEKTFRGLDPELYLRAFHSNKYSGRDIPVTDSRLAYLSPIGGAEPVKIHDLVFKDGKSAFAYNHEFGTRNMMETVLGDIHFRSRAIALAERLGPRPEKAFKTLRAKVLEEATTMDDPRQVDSLDRWTIDAAWEDITGASEVAGNISFAKNMSNVRIWMQMSKMGAVALSTPSDRVFMHTEMAAQGMGHLDAVAKHIANIAQGLRGPEDMQRLRMMGAAMDGLIGNAVARFAAHSNFSSGLHAVQRRFFDATGLNWLTDAAKGASAEITSNWLAENSIHAWKDLPGDLQKKLILYNIEAHEWDVIRNTAYTLPDGRSFITPDQIGKILDDDLRTLLSSRNLNVTKASLAKVRRDLETSLRTYIGDRTDIAVPTPGTAERRWATLGTKAGTPVGEAMRLLTLFKSFPITISQKIIGREMYGRGANSAKDWLMNDHQGKLNLAVLIAGTIAAGYLSTTLRDLLKGRTPRELVTNGKVNTDVLVESAVRGGSFGIISDVLLGEYNQGLRGFLQSQAGPVFGQLDQVANLATKLKQGNPQDDALALTEKLVLANAPLINLFYIRPVLDYFIFWSMQEAASPGYLKRMEQNVRKNNHQDFFITPSEVVNQ